MAWSICLDYHGVFIISSVKDVMGMGGLLIFFFFFLVLGWVVLARDDGCSYIKALTDCYCTGEDGEEMVDTHKSVVRTALYCTGEDGEDSWIHKSVQALYSVLHT